MDNTQQGFSQCNQFSEESIDMFKNSDHCQTHQATDMFQQRNCEQILVEEIDKKNMLYWGRNFLYELHSQSQNKRKANSNLAFAIANRMPNGIKQKVCQMINYYQDQTNDQFDLIHNLTEQNHRLRKKLDHALLDEKQNEFEENNTNDCWKKIEEKDRRVLQLEDQLLDKNHQVLKLNQQITDLYGQIKKYKKRLYEVEARSKSPRSLLS